MAHLGPGMPFITHKAVLMHPHAIPPLKSTNHEWIGKVVAEGIIMFVALSDGPDPAWLMHAYSMAKLHVA